MTREKNNVPQLIVDSKLTVRFRYVIAPLLMVTDWLFDWTVEEIYQVMKRHMRVRVAGGQWRRFEMLEGELEKYSHGRRRR